MLLLGTQSLAVQPDPWLALPVTTEQTSVEQILPPACGQSMSHFKQFHFWTSVSVHTGILLQTPNPGGL